MSSFASLRLWGNKEARSFKRCRCLFQSTISNFVYVYIREEALGCENEVPVGNSSRR